MSATPLTELPVGYYHDNFNTLVDYVHQQYADLLSDSEVALVERYRQCSPDAQRLLVRMLTRKGQWFRRSKLNYPEIDDTAQCALLLASAGLIKIVAAPPLSELLPLLSKPQWLEALELMSQDVSGLKSLRREAFDSALLALADTLSTEALLAAIDDKLYQLNCEQAFTTFKLLFFGNLSQDLTDFVLRDLGLTRYEPYHIDKSTRLFEHRGQIDKHLQYYQLIEPLEEVLKQGADKLIALHQSLPTAPFCDTTLERRVERVNLAVARQLERLERLDEAMAIYRLCQAFQAFERQARILVKLERIDEALAICRQLLESSKSDEARSFAATFGYRTAKKYKRPWPQPQTYQPPQRTLSLVQSGGGVELDVATALSEKGRCFYVENGLFCSMFALSYWPVLFAQVSGAFTNPFQTRPHDLYDSEFLSLRQQPYLQAQALVADINQHAEHYIALWQQKYGTATPLTYWEVLSPELITLALERIPSEHWRLIFERLWDDLSANRSGFCDLIYFPEDGGYELVEVKGPGDKLQKNQLRWLSYFAEHNIPHRVVYVTWNECRE